MGSTTRGILVLGLSEPAHLVIVHWVHAALVSAEAIAVLLHMGMRMVEEQVWQAEAARAAEEVEGEDAEVVVRRLPGQGGSDDTL